MKIKDFRLEKELSQEAMAKAINDHAAKRFPDDTESLSQRTYANWEKEVIPRKYWVRVIEDFTKKRVTARDFIG